MSETQARPWEIWDLPEIDARNASKESDGKPTPSGRVHCYLNGELMYSSGLQPPTFLCGTLGDPGQPMGFTFTAPIVVFPDDDAPEAALETHLEQEIPIVETDTDGDDRRCWIAADEVDWEIEVVLERTPYETGELDGGSA